MRVGALVHFATPYRMAGSETVLHEMLKTLVAVGHDVSCWVTDCPTMPPESVFEGVRLVKVRNVAVGVRQALMWRPDAMVTHHQNSVTCLRYFQQHQAIPVVYLTHNDMDVNAMPLKMRPRLVVHNSDWVAESLGARFPKPGAAIVVRPPLDCARHQLADGFDPATRYAVTLININEHKGSNIFYELARRNPDVPFLAVLGGHGVQVKPPAGLRNVELVSPSHDLRPVWEHTKVLLMPSIYESFGLVGVEAGCTGIPTIAAPTPGLQESQGAAGIFVADRDDVEEWDLQLVGLLADDAAYAIASQRAAENSRLRCAETTEDLLRFVDAVEALAGARVASA